MTLLARHPNFRDVGGLPAAGGRRVRAGLVYRAGYLEGLTAGERDELARLGIRTVCDLRTSAECELFPNVWHGQEGVEILALGLADRGMRATGDPVVTILRHGITEVTEEDVARGYRHMVDTHADAFARVVEVCAGADRHAVVVHCSAGKDRTGLAIAFLLTVLGVPRAEVVADYERTNALFSADAEARARPRLEGAGLDPERLRLYFAAPRSALLAAFAHVEETAGSVEAYLTGPGGLDPAALHAVRETLLEAG